MAEYDSNIHISRIIFKDIMSHKRTVHSETLKGATGTLASALCFFCSPVTADNCYYGWVRQVGKKQVKDSGTVRIIDWEIAVWEKQGFR